MVSRWKSLTEAEADPARPDVRRDVGALAILPTTSGVRLVGRPSPTLPRLLVLCVGSPFTLYLFVSLSASSCD
jgi:hypothetical protein